ncbi:unnamed protein product [Lymnaea stagnalis]|uniref:NADH dehydrogenase [ubiquinone] 1 beta subcomplex subunit 10 n=1 Tax=Lymnaea stagnalis TaxID=6523 RepID=A0AAV2I2S9_LYMST
MGGHDDTEAECIDESQSKNKGISFTDLKVQNLALGFFSAIDGTVTSFREKVVLPLQSKNKEKFYHRRFNRVPTVDQCDYEDPVCIYEADEQFYRDKLVDSNIVKILRQRKIECMAWEGPDSRYKCKKIEDEYENAATNWFIKYGEMRATQGAIEAYMKQKHRLIWERRNPDKKLH